MVVSNPQFREFMMDIADDPYGSAQDVFVFAADARLYGQEKLFDFGLWNMDNAIDAQIRLEDEFGWHEIPALGLTTVLTMAGWAPLVVYTWAPYTNPFVYVTAPIAFALDAYNIYRYFD